MFSPSAPSRLRSSPRSQGRKDGESVLFLDLNGVLHPAEGTSHQFRDGCCRQLKRVVAETRCRVVLSSSWRNYESSMAQAMSALRRHGIELAGVTPDHSEELGGCRATEILAFVDASGCDETRWVALDDEDLVGPQLPGGSRGGGDGGGGGGGGDNGGGGSSSSEGGPGLQRLEELSLESMFPGAPAHVGITECDSEGGDGGGGSGGGGGGGTAAADLRPSHFWSAATSERMASHAVRTDCNTGMVSGDADRCIAILGRVVVAAEEAAAAETAAVAVSAAEQLRKATAPLDLV